MRRKYNKDVYMKEVTKSIWHLAEEKDIDGYIGFKYIKKSNTLSNIIATETNILGLTRDILF